MLPLVNKNMVESNSRDTLLVLVCHATAHYILGSVRSYPLDEFLNVIVNSHIILSSKALKVFHIIVNQFFMFELIHSIEMVVRIIHESALGKPTMMKNESNATISQHLCLIIYGMARALPTKYNLEPVTVSTYNVMKYATHSINDEKMRALFSTNQGNQGVE
jgi:hypothetical protein